MKIVFLILIFALAPIFSFASTASDFIVNRQSIYAVPRSVSNVLILDLTLPEPLQSIKINNAGTAQQWDISKISVFEDGASLGWDGDEKEVVSILSPPFFDTLLSGDFSQKRIFVTVSISSIAVSERTIKPQLQLNSVEFASGNSGPSDQALIGFERMILTGSSYPAVPVAPLAQTGEALSTSTVRWHFLDLSNNEFGFKILDGNLKEVARVEQADFSYLDETGLTHGTEYFGRRVIAFNDKGESLGSTLTVFPAVRTLALPEIKEVRSPEEIEPQLVEKIAEPTLFETIQTKIADIQRQISEFIKQLDELIKQSSATVLGALQGFFQALFGK